VRRRASRPTTCPLARRSSKRCSTPAHTHHKPDIEPVVCGPSNVGNYFAAHGIDATCGFGVTYENLHAPNERIKLNTIQMTSDVYATAIHSLLASQATLPTPEHRALGSLKVGSQL
jgi:hypothetical protein